LVTRNMGQADKKLRKWLNNPPTHAPVDTVRAMLRRFFDSVEWKGGSHIIVTDDRLQGMKDVGPLNDYSVPVSGGQRVKGRYLRWIAEAVQYIEETEED